MDDTTTETAPPPPSGSGPERPPLVRRRHGRMLAGVAVGIASHLRIDVTLVRIGFVILAFTGGAGILAYLAGWVLLPEEDDGVTEPATWKVQHGAPFWIGVGLLGLSAIALVEHTTPFGSSIGAPLVLIAIGAALWKVSQDRADRADRPPVGAPPPPSAQAAAAAPPAGDTSAALGTPAAPASTRPMPAAATWTPPPPRARPPSVLGRVTLALALIAVGGGALLDELDLARFTALDAAATALLVVGLGLVVGAWFGRARGLIAAGLVLLPVVVVTSVLHGTGIDVRAGAGDRVHTVTATSPVEPRYSLGAGYLELDLTDLEPAPGDTRTDIRMGAGEVVLRVPEDASVVIDATVQLGAVSLPTGDRAGAGLTERLELGPRDAAGATLHLDIEIGVGELDVRIVPTSEDAA